MRLTKDPVLYKKATQKLLAQIDALHLSSEKHDKAIRFVKLFREAFTKEEVKKATALANHKDNVWDLGYDSAGFCRVASISFMMLMDFHDWDLMAVDKDKGQWYYSHHYLRHKETGKILDLTYDQFLSQVPYKAGEVVKPGSFLNDETNVFAKSIGIDLVKAITETKGK